MNTKRKLVDACKLHTIPHKAQIGNGRHGELWSDLYDYWAKCTLTILHVCYLASEGYQRI